MWLLPEYSQTRTPNAKLLYHKLQTKSVQVDVKGKFHRASALLNDSPHLHPSPLHFVFVFFFFQFVLNSSLTHPVLRHARWANYTMPTDKTDIQLFDAG